MGWHGQRLVLGILLGACACGYTDSGSGTLEVEVEVRVTYTADLVSELRAAVQDDGGNPLTDVQVQLISEASGSTFELAGGHPGRFGYRADIPDQGYQRRLELRVLRQGETLLWGRLEGPGRHYISRPKPGDEVIAGAGLELGWGTYDGIPSDMVEIDLDLSSYDSVVFGDPGHAEVPAALLVAGSETLSVVRRNQVYLAGGLGAASMSIGYEIRQRLLVTGN